MSNGLVGSAQSLFQEAQIPTIKSYLSSLHVQGRHDDLRTIYTHFLKSPELSRAGMLIACYRTFNLFAVELYASFDREIAFQLVQLAQALYAPQILDCDEQLEVLIMDLEEKWEWLAHLENAELLPANFQVLLDELCPGLFHEMARLSAVRPLQIGAVVSPLRLMLCLGMGCSDEKDTVLSGITDPAMARCLVRLGMVDASSLGRLRNPMINEAYLASCLL